MEFTTAAEIAHSPVRVDDGIVTGALSKKIADNKSKDPLHT